MGFLVRLAFPILHTSTLYIFGSQEESRVGTGVSALGSSLVFDFYLVGGQDMNKGQRLHHVWQLPVFPGLPWL